MLLCFNVDSREGWQVDWDNEPGFNRKKEQFIQLDLGAWLKKHGIEEEGRRQGAVDQPRTDADELDATEAQILGWVNRRARVCRENVSGHLSDLQRDLVDMENDQGLEDLGNEAVLIRNDGELALDAEVGNGRNLLVSTEQAVREDNVEFRRFRNQAALTRQADYAHRRGSRTFILVCFVVEVLLNATLLMEVNAFGLVGSGSQMGLISFINILAAGLAMGALLRQRNHVALVRKMIAWVGIAILLITTFAFNLLIGHFRDSMQAVVNDPTADILSIGNDVLDRFLDNPLALDSFQSSLLALLGFLFFCIASWKWFQRDDPYPEYGRRHRQLDARKRDYVDKYERAQAELKKVYDENKSKLEDIGETLKIKLSKWGDICVRGQHLVDEYPVNLGQYPHDLDYLIQAYRTANKTARSEPSPPHFKRHELIDADILERPPAFNPPAETNLSEVMEQVHGAVGQLQSVYGQAAKKYRTLEELDVDGTRS